MPKIKTVVWSSEFKRSYKRRIAGTPDDVAFERKLELFLADPSNPVLKPHKLAGKLHELCSFSIGYDCRVLYKFISADTVLLVNIGTHDDVY